MLRKYNLLFLGINILIAISLVTVSSLYASFSDNFASPPDNNTSAPINTSATTQVKQGVLVSNSEVQAPVFRSSQNGGYYLHPIGSSRLNAVYADHIHSYGYIDTADVYLRNAGRWASQVRGVNGYCIQCRGRDSGAPGAQCASIGNWTNWSGTGGGSHRYEDVCQILIY